MRYLDMILEQINLRLDAKFTAVLDLQLEKLKAQTYDIKYPAMKARMLIPLATDTDPAAESIAYLQWDVYGMAEIIANYADDLPQVDAKAEKFSTPVISIGTSYSYSIMDLRRSAMSGAELSMRRPRSARRAIEQKIDDIASVGDAKTKLRGCLNHPNVSVLTAATDGTATYWVQGRATPKTAALIQKDMHVMVNTVRSNTKEIHSPDVMVLPSFEFGYLAQTPVGTDNQTSILKSFLANSPFVRNIDSWYKLDTANAAGTGPRAWAYERVPEVLELEIPQEFEQFPPQAQNLAFVVPCHARIGGVVMHYPLGAVYMDGI